LYQANTLGGPKLLILLVPQEGFEPPTHALRMRCSTPELLRLFPIAPKLFKLSLQRPKSL
jgi:hypothetical protein